MKIDRSKLTPMMRQYFDIKDRYQEYILFYRLGDFYEMFFDDALLASRELEITLTGKACGLEERAPLCGVPYHSVDGYIARLIDKGFKVAICEQIEDPAKAKGLVKRDVVRIVTPGTVIEPHLLDDKSNNYLMTFWEGDGVYGVAYADITTGELKVTHFSGQHAIQKVTDEILKISPKELIVSDMVDEHNIVMSTIQKYDAVLITKYPHASFKLKNATDTLQRVFHVYAVEGIGLEEEPLIGAAGALMAYIEETQKVDLVHFDKAEVYASDHFMVLDKFTRRNLELTQTIRTKDKKGSLLWVLDKTTTAMGARLLRKWVEEPLLALDQIQSRQDAVQGLYEDLVTRDRLRELLREIYDLERLASKLVYNNANARDLIALKQSLAVLPEIKSILGDRPDGMLTSVLERIDELRDVHDLIHSAIVDEPPISVKDGGIIRETFNEEVAELRDAVTNGKQWIMGMESKERERLGVKSLKIGFNKVFGYYIDVTRANSHLVPEDYIRKQTLANSERYITPELKEIEQKVLGAEERITTLEYDLFQQLKSDLLVHVNRILGTAKAVASLDVLGSFAEVSVRYDYVKPEVQASGDIHITEGRHPVVERISETEFFVPNDTTLNLDDDQFYIITGPNMAGKSTYLRQVALITLMAQIGCFVPAQEATIGIVDRIFTRVGASDDLSQGQSTFMVEMSELANILHNATDKSLIILDEIGRGTSTYDGLSIAWAVVEHLTEDGGIGAKTMFATHYHELTELEGRFAGVKNYCISVKEAGDDIVFLRKIIRGGANQSYGIQVAKLAGVPEGVIEKAKKILHKLEEHDINNNIANLSVERSEAKRDNVVEYKAAQSAVDPVQSRVAERSDGLPEHSVEEVPVQLSLFEAQSNELIEEMKEIDVMNLTPMEAMNALYKLVNKAKKQ